MSRKPKTVRAVLPNRGVEAKYRKDLQKMIADMHGSVEYWLLAGYKKHPPAMAKLVEHAQDASPVDFMKRILADLTKRWTSFFDKKAETVAGSYLTSMFKASDTSFKSALADAGWVVDFKMTPSTRDAFNASLGENVGLIRSIPEKYLQQVEGIVMRNYSKGRDLKTMTKDLKELYPKNSKRAELIARDQSNKANAVVNRARELELGLTEAFWMHSHAGKVPRPSHLAANGKRYKISEGCLIDGEHIQPGEKIGCRCSHRIILPI